MSVFGTLKGLLDNGKTKTFRSTALGEIPVEMSGSSVSAFGDLITAENTPLIQYDFVYQSTINPQTMIHTVANGATVDTNTSRLRVQTGTNPAGSAEHQSTRVARYRAGQGNTARFTYAWTNNAANSTHIVGMANVSAGVTAIDGYFFGYNGTTFGILHRLSGSNFWTAQTAWNVDVCDGSNSDSNPSGFNWNKTFGNVMMIRYPYLGYGDIKFFVLNPNNGTWILCHVIKYANTSALVQLSNPGLNFYVQALNSGNTTNLIGYCGSVSVMLSGVRVFNGPQYGIDNKITIGTTELPIVSLRNSTSFNGVPNRGLLRLRSLSVSADNANTDCRIRLRSNPTLTGSTFVNGVNGTASAAGLTITAGQSMASYDIAATAVTQLNTIPSATDVRFNVSLARNTGYQIDLAPYDFFVIPGETLTITGLSGAANNNVTASMNWSEDQ